MIQEVVILIQKSAHWSRCKRWDGGSDSICHRKLETLVKYGKSDVLQWVAACTSNINQCGGVK